MGNLYLYLIVFGTLIGCVGIYCLFKYIIFKNNANKDNIVKWTARTLAILASVCFFAAYFVQPGAMKSSYVSGTTFEGGCHFLTGIPYGDNQVANFFAWFQIFIYYPSAIGAILLFFYRFKAGNFLQRYIITPVIIINAFLFFNLNNAICGLNNYDYKSILLACEVGLVTALTIVTFFDGLKEKYEINAKLVWHGIGLFVFGLIMFIPAYSLAVLLPPDMIFFGQIISTQRVADFSFLHRLVIYGIVIVPFVVYFLFRNTDLKERTFVLLIISFAAMTSYMLIYGFDAIIKVNGIDSPVGKVYIDVRNLPFHLCHTAIFVIPFVIILKSKKLFYFTYFINVFGAICAILMPNTGTDMHPYSPEIWSYWMNHMCAFMMPLLCVALGLFGKPKMKQMGYSLAAFGGYFVFIVFLNAWLSNYVPGYNPDVVGSGTDYLFINGDFILGKLGTSAKNFFLSVKWRWSWGNYVFNLYPLYQFTFLFGYVVIAFAMWFVYSLFFKIADAHYDVYCKLKVARLENISFKETHRKEELIMDKNEHPARLEFIHFSKKYGSSKVFSANDVNLVVNGGEIFGFLGPNGAGKSTSIKTAIGIQPVTDGEILVCGYSIKTETVQAKSQIGYVPDHYALYEKLTGREYINYIADLYHVSKKDRDERIDYYVQLLELTQAFDNRMQTYSHGMKQKITIMAALIHNPKVWILDEPLTGLDPQSIFQVKQCMINHAAKGNIVFFSSHIIDVVEKLCTRIAIIRKGHIVYESDMKQLEKDHPEGLEAFYMKTISEEE